MSKDLFWKGKPSLLSSPLDSGTLLNAYGCNPSIDSLKGVDGFRGLRIWFDGVSAAAGGLVHFNCHNQELTPFRPAGISLVIEKLLVGCDTTEDALAAAFCLLRCVRPGL